MEPASYRDPDYRFGQLMLTLRSALKLTQRQLAGALGVSRRSVGEWEGGYKYPNSAHLRAFIELAYAGGAFTNRAADEEIRALWSASRQKDFLDEAWLQALLQRSHRESAITSFALSPAASKPVPPVRTPLVPPEPRVSWDDAPQTPDFFGRAWELEQLSEWVVDRSCRVVTVVGLGGIGKSSLVVTLMRQVATSFDVVIWRSVRDAPDLQALLDNLLRDLAVDAADTSLTSHAQRMSLLLEQLARQRVLLVIDNLESLLGDGASAGTMRPGYEAYGALLRRIAETEHQSCLILTSREKPADLTPLESSRSQVRELRLARLDEDACEQLLARHRISGSLDAIARLISAYAGNPLALKIVGRTIVELFGGEIEPFLEGDEIIYGGVRELLGQQYARLAPTEKLIVRWLAILREPVTLGELRAAIHPTGALAHGGAELLDAVEGLNRRSLVERGTQPGLFTLQSVVLEYVTGQLIFEVCADLEAGRLDSLVLHGLEQAGAKDYLRQTQRRLLVAPLLTRLETSPVGYGGLDAKLVAMIDALRLLPAGGQGYAPANMLALLRLLRGNLRGLDLSGLSLHGAFLQGVEMQDSSLRGALVSGSIFTETFDAITALAINPAGTRLAAATRRGEIRVWRLDSAGGHTPILILQRAWRGHADHVWALDWSPDGLELASGSWDGAVKLWAADSAELRWTGRHTRHVNGVKFSPDGELLASSGIDAAVRLWSRVSGAELARLHHPGPVTSLAWNRGGDLLATGEASGALNLWRVAVGGSATMLQAITAHDDWVDAVAFAPGEETLASELGPQGQVMDDRRCWRDAVKHAGRPR